MRIKELAVRVHTGCALWSYVTHLATCFSEKDTAAVCDDAKCRAVHLHLFSTHAHLHGHMQNSWLLMDPSSL